MVASGIDAFKPEFFNKHKHQKMCSIHCSHRSRINYPEKVLNNKIVQIWEHDWDLMVKGNDIHFKSWIKLQDVVEPLNPRDALYGLHQSGQVKLKDFLNQTFCYEQPEIKSLIYKVFLRKIFLKFQF